MPTRVRGVPSDILHQPDDLVVSSRGESKLDCKTQGGGGGSSIEYYIPPGLAQSSTMLKLARHIGQLLARSTQGFRQSS